MRCYGCNSTTHLLRHCPTTTRPEELKVEFNESVFDIDERVKTLNSCAIFRTPEGAVNGHSLKQVVDEKYWEHNWKISEMFYKISNADVVRVMVEVEDISLVPKVVQCSYKAISNDIIRSYSVSLVLSSQCLPVSALNQENYKLFEEGGGISETVEEKWSSGSAVGDGLAVRGGIKQGTRKVAGGDGSAD